MGLIAWIIFGALAGWITSKIAGTDAQQGWVMNIVLGIVGAIVGGFIWSRLADDNFNTGFNIPSLLVAIFGGLIVSYAVRFISRQSKRFSTKHTNNGRTRHSPVRPLFT